MNNLLVKTCACKGIRSCLLCENVITKPKNGQAEYMTLTYCSKCAFAWSATLCPSECCESHSGVCLEFSGIRLIPDFISETEEKAILDAIGSSPWVESQSGRRKQDYGVKVNFKKQKINFSGFTGLPKYSEPLYRKMQNVDVLKDFVPVELCNLEYDPARGSSIDPHTDDFWIWGDRLVTLNLLSDTKYTMHPVSATPLTVSSGVHCEKLAVSIRLPRRSLIVMYGAARTEWTHGIHRDDITERRVAVTLRSH